MCTNKGSSHGLLTCVSLSMISVTSLISISSPSCLVLQMEVLRGSSYQGPDRWHTNTYSPSVILHRSIRCASGFSIIIREPLCTAVSQNLPNIIICQRWTVCAIFIHSYKYKSLFCDFVSFFFGNYTQRLVGPGCCCFFTSFIVLLTSLYDVCWCVFLFGQSHISQLKVISDKIWEAAQFKLNNISIFLIGTPNFC